MKKLALIISILSVIILGTIIYISNQNSTLDIQKYYSIPTSQIYDYCEDKKMTIEIYSNQGDSIILYPEQNEYSLVGININYPLNEIEVTSRLNYRNSFETIYKYVLTFNIFKPALEELIFDNCHLIIRNNEYVLDLFIGYIGIYQNLSKLTFSDLYGNFSYIQNELYLVGITICLDSKYHFLNSLNVGYGNGNIKLIEKDSLYSSEINLLNENYQLLEEVNNNYAYQLNALGNYYFIPISYIQKCLITTTAMIFTIEGDKYILEDFNYLFNEILLKDYPTLKCEGEIINA